MGLVNVNFDRLSDSLNVSKPSRNETSTLEDTAKPTVQGLSIGDLLKEYPADVFSGLGELGPELHLEVEEGAEPVQLSPGRIPEALKRPLKDHLDKLEQDDIIEKVESPTDRISAIVAAKKGNGDIGLCLDPKPLNKVLKR